MKLVEIAGYYINPNKVQYLVSDHPLMQRGGEVPRTKIIMTLEKITVERPKGWVALVLEGRESDSEWLKPSKFHKI